MLNKYLQTPPRTRKSRPRKKQIRKYRSVCPQFIQEFKADLDAGWSIGYACRSLVRHLHAVKDAFNEYPELREIYDDYMFKRTVSEFDLRNKSRITEILLIYAELNRVYIGEKS